MQDGLSINQIKANTKKDNLLVCIVHKGLDEAQKLIAKHSEEYEIKYPAEYPKDIIYVCLGGYHTLDNYKSVYSWIESNIASGIIDPENPGPYEFNSLET